MITIIIPTMNRSDFLIRLLNYYTKVGYAHWICIGDSSEGDHLERTREAIVGLKGRLKVVYRECPGLSEYECTSQLIQAVSTPYLAWVADDDFILPPALDECVRFLGDNRHYSVALGRAVVLSLKTSGPYGDVQSIGPYGLRSIEAETARERLINHLSHYSNPNFGVHRTNEFIAAYHKVVSLSDKSFTELLPNCMSCLQGNVKRLDNLYLVRQGHDRRYLLPDAYDWITGPNWHTSYQIFSNCLAEELVKQDGITHEEAHAVVKQAFWAYLKNGLYRKYQQRYEGKRDPGAWSYLKKIGKHFPIASNYLRRLRPHSDGRSLSDLLNPKSPYHNDFMPVYRAVTAIAKQQGDN